MGQSSMRIVFSSAITDWSEKNASFDSGVLRVAYAGKNRNNSYISKDTFERCIESIYNCPIVCRYDRENDEIGSHDVDLVEDADGGLRIVNLTSPVGVIPESAKHWWEKIEDDSGVHDYLCVEALIWKRQEAYRKIKQDGITDESMEITILEGGMKDGVYVIDRFEFTALCLLGTAEPCFESAGIEMFSLGAFKQQLSDMMRELKETYALEQPSKEVAIEKTDLEGGGRGLDEKTALMDSYGLRADMLDFSLDDFSLEELKEKFEAMKTASQDPEDKDFALESQVRDELMQALEAEKVERGDDDWRYTIPRYWFFDYDKELMEVYGTSAEDYHIYGFQYSMNGDHAVIDWESKKRMKIALAAYDEGDAPSPLERMFSAVEGDFRTGYTQLSEKYQTAEGDMDTMKAELDTLRKFKADAESARQKAEAEKVFEKFEDLNGVEAFEALRGSADSYSAEELEEKCYALRGRQATVGKFSKESKAPKLKVEKTHLEKEPYGGVFTEYGITAPGQGS